MRQFYLRSPKSQTVSGKLSWFLTLSTLQMILLLSANLLFKNIVTMKRVLFYFLSTILFIATFLLQSCGDEKYTVWTDTETYSQFVSETGRTLGDGNYVKVEIGRETWEEMAKSLTSEGRHRWNEATIKKWFISYGFGEAEATRESSWLTIVDHGFVVVRNGDIVNMILK